MVDSATPSVRWRTWCPPEQALIETCSLTSGLATSTLGCTKGVLTSFRTFQTLYIGGDLDISQLNSLLQAYTGRVYVMDIPLAYSTSYFLMSCGCSLVLDATHEPLSLRSSLTGAILPNNSAAVALVRTPQDWNHLRKNFLATGSTEFSVTIEKAKGSQRTR